MSIRVLIADDQASARRSLHALLTAMRWSAPKDSDQPIHENSLSVEVVGIVESGQQAVEQMQANFPNVVVMDLPLHPEPDSEMALDGPATIRIIKRRWPDIRIVVLTMYATSRALVLAAGADVFLLKGCSTKELMEAIMPRLSDGHDL